MKIISLSSALLFLLTTQTATAGCALRDTVVQRLKNDYSETLIVRGLQNRNALVKIFGSAETGTFTVLITNSTGVSCIVSTGTNLMVEKAAKKVDEPEGEPM